MLTKSPEVDRAGEGIFRWIGCSIKLKRGPNGPALRSIVTIAVHMHVRVGAETLGTCLDAHASRGVPHEELVGLVVVARDPLHSYGGVHSQ